MEYAPIEADRLSFLAYKGHSFGLPSLFYGSLQAPEIFEIVIGRPMEIGRVEPVCLPGHELARIFAGDAFPGVFPTVHESSVDCLLVTGLSLEEELRVAWFEWEEYKLGKFQLADGRAAQAFVPDTAFIRDRFGEIDYQPWSFDHWRENFLAASIPGAVEWMAGMPDVSEIVGAASGSL